MRLGVISDTHGLLRPEVLPALAGVDHILHAGDVGDVTILEALRSVAPTTAIRGNIDIHGPCALLPPTEVLEFGGCLVYMLHSIAELDLSPRAAGIGLVIYGHSHQPLLEHRQGVVYLNPGSAGPRRFRLPVTIAIVSIDNGTPSAEIIPLLP